MNSLRIGCLSYVPLGYAVPQIPQLLQSLRAHYQPIEPIRVLEPEWGGFAEQSTNLPRISLYRFNANNSSGQEHYRFSAEWLRVHRFHVLVVTHFKFLRWLIASGHRPRYVIFYNFENPCADEHPSPEDFAALKQGAEWLDLILFTEKHRQEQFYDLCGLREVPSVLAYNAPPHRSYPIQPSSARNSRMILQGTIDFRRTYIDYLCNAGRPPLPCDVYGSLSHHNAAVVITDERVSQASSVKFRGLVPNGELARIRADYAYSLVMWKPLSENYFFACPNKFFECIASGVPPIVAPHPQCAEIVGRYKLGIQLVDWSFASFCAGLERALDLLRNGGHEHLVTGCLAAHDEELNWEAQFANIAEYLPPVAAVVPVQCKAERKFVLVDPSLRDRVGHHYVYGQSCLVSSQREGFASVAMINRMQATPIEGADLIFPVFSNDFWGRKLTHTGFDPQPADSADFGRQLADNLGRLNLTPADLIFIPNISDPDLEALAHLLESQPGLRNLKWHIFIRHDLTGDASQVPSLPRRLVSFVGRHCREATPSGRALFLRRLQKLLGDRLHLCTDTVPLALQHEWRTGIPFTVLPIPAALESADFAPIANQNAPGDPICVVYAGDARAEKGFTQLPAVIDSCRDLIDSGRLRFRIQTHHPHGDAAIDQAKVELSAHVRPGIELLDDMLSDADYLSLIQSANVLLVTYDPVAYRRRSSHVFIESLANGRIPIVRRGSWMAGELPANCGWVVDRAEDIGTALRRICATWADQQSLIANLSAKAREFHTARNLVRMLARHGKP